MGEEFLYFKEESQTLCYMLVGRMGRGGGKREGGNCKVYEELNEA